MDQVKINNRLYTYWRDLELFVPLDAEVTAFYSYTSGTRQRVLEIEYKHNDLICKLRDNLVVMSQQLGINAYCDNKTVFEISHKSGQKIYLGWYDCKFSIGLGVWTERAENIRRR